MVSVMLSMLLGFSAHADVAPSLLIRAANGYSVPYDANPSEASGCVVGVSKTTEVKVVSETDTHFEVEWIKPIRGCFWQTTFGDVDLKRGFIRKDDLIWARLDEEEELPKIISRAEKGDRLRPPENCDEIVVTGAEMNPPLQATEEKDPDPQSLSEALSSFDSVIDHMRWEGAGIKNPKQIDRYMKCYPYGKHGLENYQKYSKYIDLASETIRLQWGETDVDIYEVNPALMRCMIRRESGFSPEERSGTGAVGLGQHIDQNIEHISNRINKAGSWEQKVWRNFFKEVRETREGRFMLAGCLGSATNPERPVFSTEADAACPLQSIAASAIYNLMVQRALVTSSKEMSILRDHALDFQLAIAAGYNLGDGASSKAVKDKFVGKWLKSIIQRSRKSPVKGKEKEVRDHIDSIRNCMEHNNWDPMFSRDRNRCD